MKRAAQSHCENRSCTMSAANPAPTIVIVTIAEPYHLPRPTFAEFTVVLPQMEAPSFASSPDPPPPRV